MTTRPLVFSPVAITVISSLVGATVGYLAAGTVSPPTSHFVFVPSVALIGVVLGFVLGGRAARDASEGEQRAAAAKAERKAAREARPPDSNALPLTKNPRPP